MATLSKVVPIVTEQCIHKQPNASMCFVCGRDNPIGLHMEFYDDGEKMVVSKITPPAYFEGYPGVLHGGIVATILDEVVGRVSMVQDHHRFMMTVKLLTKYRHPVPIGEELIAIGRAVRIGGRIGKAQGEIVLSDGTVACEAEMVLTDMPAQLATPDRQQRLEWRLD